MVANGNMKSYTNRDRMLGLQGETYRRENSSLRNDKMKLQKQKDNMSYYSR